MSVFQLTAVSVDQMIGSTMPVVHYRWIKPCCSWKNETANRCQVSWIEIRGRAFYEECKLSCFLHMCCLEVGVLKSARLITILWVFLLLDCPNHYWQSWLSKSQCALLAHNWLQLFMNVKLLAVAQWIWRCAFFVRLLLPVWDIPCRNSARSCF